MNEFSSFDSNLVANILDISGREPGDLLYIFLGERLRTTILDHFLDDGLSSLRVSDLTHEVSSTDYPLQFADSLGNLSQ